MDKSKIRTIWMVLWIMMTSAAMPYSLEPDKKIQMNDFRKNVNWLNTMVRETKIGADSYFLIQSYEAIDDRCWIYDQALAVIAFTALGQRQVAEKILLTLKKLQNSDGSFDFSYQISTLQSTSKRRYTGSIAWVAMAINFYQAMTGNNRYNVLLWKILDWISKQQVTDKLRETYGGVSLGVRDDAFSMEHNLDCFSAFYHYHNEYFVERARKIEQFVFKHLYQAEPQPHFLTGYRDHSLYLDCQSWAVLALGNKYCQVLSFADGNFLVKNGILGENLDIQGYFERQAKDAPVWSEGTEGMALAYYLCGISDKGDFYHDQVRRMMGEKGGIAYATENSYEFSTSTSVAGTVWYIFYEMKLNPLNPGRRTMESVKSFLKNFKVLTKNY